MENLEVAVLTLLHRLATSEKNTFLYSLNHNNCFVVERNRSME